MSLVETFVKLIGVGGRLVLGTTEYFANITDDRNITDNDTHFTSTIGRNTPIDRGIEKYQN